MKELFQTIVKAKTGKTSSKNSNKCIQLAPWGHLEPPGANWSHLGNWTKPAWRAREQRGRK